MESRLLFDMSVRLSEEAPRGAFVVMLKQYELHTMDKLY